MEDHPGDVTNEAEESVKALEKEVILLINILFIIITNINLL